MLRAVVAAACLLLLVAAPASAHDGSAHRDTRDQLAPLDLVATVRTVERTAGADDGGTGGGLPITWCGTERTADDTVNNVFAAGAPQFKVVYAYPDDRPNRFAQWKDALQRNVSLIGRFMGAQSGGTKAPRFDMGTDCGPDYVDIQVVALPAGRAAYVDDMDALTSAVQSVLGSPGGPRNTVIFADTLSSYGPGTWWGLGSRWGDDRAGSANYSNNGGLWAAIWIPDGESAPGLSSEGFWPEGMLHEMSHNLGAVQSSAPHSSGYGHCWDGYDVMCYYPDGPSPRHVMTYECPTIAGVMNQGYDCGSDDYFNVAPAAGSYLATHWNVYDNVFLSGCAQIAPACGGDATTPAPALPISTAAPAVLGTAEIGSQLSLSKGTWRNEPTTYGYQWQRGGNTTWVDIPGATDSTYTVSGDDVGYRLRGLVIATNADGSTVASSGQTQMVIEAGDELPPPNATPTPTPTPTATPRPGTASPPVAAPAGAAPRVPGPSSGRVKLKVFAGKGRGKALGRVAFAIAAGRLTATTPRLRLAKGRYDVALCTTSLAGGAQRCAHRRFSAKGGHGRPPRLAIGVPAGAGARAALSVTAVGRQFGARTASRAATGLALG